MAMNEIMTLIAGLPQEQQEKAFALFQQQSGSRRRSLRGRIRHRPLE